MVMMPNYAKLKISYLAIEYFKTTDPLPECLMNVMKKQKCTMVYCKCLGCKVQSCKIFVSFK